LSAVITLQVEPDVEKAVSQFELKKGVFELLLIQRF
jgi:hypothetical protein